MVDLKPDKHGIKRSPGSGIFMHYLNIVADFMAQPNSLLHALARFALLVLLVFVSVWISHYVDTPVSVGWFFGYLWGTLTAYGSLRPHLK
jgi:hypothetical protein